MVLRNGKVINKQNGNIEKEITNKEVSEQEMKEESKETNKTLRDRKVGGDREHH